MPDYSREAVIKRLEQKGIEIEPTKIEAAAVEGRISPDFYEAAMVAVPFDLTDFGPARLRGSSARPPQVPPEEREQIDSIFAPPGMKIPAMDEKQRDYYVNKVMDILDELFVNQPSTFQMEADIDKGRRMQDDQTDRDVEYNRKLEEEQKAFERAKAKLDKEFNRDVPTIPEGGDAPGGGR